MINMQIHWNIYGSDEDFDDEPVDSSATDDDYGDNEEPIEEED